MIDLPAPFFVGFMPKRTMAALPLLAAVGVVDIAAVSNCMSSPPDEWIQAWKHNDHGFYDSEDLARSVIPRNEDVRAYDLYAYELFPLIYADALEPLAVSPAPGAIPSDYEFLGLDIVSRSMASFFECSMLSCNLGATTFGANAHCLITNRDAACAAFLRIGESGDAWEPGPYFLFAVHRKRR
jgi:hypothetical protein